MQIALFGTSADPPTLGHQAVLTWLAGRFDHVAVWAADNPLKTHRAPLSERMGMLQALIEDLDPRHERVCLQPELSHSRTVVTLERSRDRWPGDELWLVIGADLVEQLPRWNRSAEIFSLAGILVMPRPGYAIAPAALQRLQDLGARVEVADLQSLPVSSSDYRERRAINHLPRAVQAYIQREGLYWQKAG